MEEITNMPSSEIKIVTPEQPEPLGDRMTGRVNRFVEARLAGWKEFGEDRLESLKNAAIGAKRLGKAGILAGGMTLAAACGGEIGPLPAIATATPTEIRPSVTATLEPGETPIVGEQTEEPTEQPSVSHETEVVPKIEITGTVIPFDEDEKKVTFHMPETVTKGENPLIPEGEIGVYVFQLGKDAGITSVRASDILGLQQVGKFKGYSMSTPGIGNSNSATGKDMLAVMETFWKQQYEDYPKLDDEARAVIEEIEVKLLHLNYGRLQVALFIPNESYTYRTQSGEFIVNPNNLSFRFEQEGDNPITGDGIIHVPSQSRAAEIPEFTIVGSPDIVTKPETSGQSDVKVTVIGTVEPDETPVGQATPTAQPTVIPTPDPTEQPRAGENEEIRRQNELLQKTPTLTTAPIVGSSIAYRLNDDGSFTIEDSGYDYMYSLKLKESTLNEEGTNELALDLRSFAGMTINPLPGLNSVANFAIEIPENFEEISQLNRTINVGGVLADVNEHIPVADLNRDQERFAAQAAQLGFGQAIDNYVQNMQNLYGLKNAEDVKAMLRIESQETLAREAPGMITEIRDRIAGGAAIPDDIQQEFTFLQSSIIQTIETRGMDAGIEEIKREVGRIYSVIQRKYGAYVSLPSHESVMDTVNQELSGVFMEIVPDLADPSQVQLPEHLANSQITIKDGSIHIPVGEDRTVSFAVNEPEEFSGEMHIKGNVNGDEFSLHTRRAVVR